MQISKNVRSTNLRWAFLFPPGKSLKAAEKKALLQAFRAKFDRLNAIYIRNQTKTASARTAAANRTRTAASRKNALSKKLDRQAGAKSEAIRDKQRIADRQSRSRPAPIRRQGGKLSPVMLVIILVVIIAVIALAFFSRRGSAEEDFAPAPIGTTRYDVDYDDGIFMAGGFWYMGEYYPSESVYYSRHGRHYTNTMYLDNYDRYGMGQGRNAALDHELREDIDEREYLHNEAAEAGYEADNLRADAEEMDAEAEAAEGAAEEYEDSSEVLNEDAEFADDDSGEEEDDFSDDEEPAESDEGGFTDDEDNVS